MLDGPDIPIEEEPPLGRRSAVAAKWGEAANAGFQLVPDVLLKNQSQLGLTATELVVLLNLTMHWWYPMQRPFPRSTTIANRIGVDVRTVQRAITRLSDLGLIERVKVPIKDRSSSTVIDLTGLVRRLVPLALNDIAYRPRIAVLSDFAPGGAAPEPRD